MDENPTFEWRPSVTRSDRKVVISKHWADGGAGAEDLAKTVVDVVDNHSGKHKYVYEDNISLWDKIEAIATKVYGAGEITAPPNVRAQIDKLNDLA